MVVALPKTYTPEDLLTMPDGDRYELVDGQLVERNVSALSSYVGGEVFLNLGNFVKKSKLGWVFPDNTSFLIFRDEPKKVRKADTAFISAGNLTLEELQTQGQLTVVPELVVEVVSPNDLAYEVNAKIDEWLGAGVSVVWEIDPELKIVDEHRADGSLRRLSVKDHLTAESILPGFSCPIASLFPC